ncbi:hypothetical protein [Mesorhizobium sp. M0571]|uniref:hypothetical protein n=1 Tax=Mesorhizobium sp. M0571 TaxID=2956960 RepID=UPI00333C8995
MNLHRHISEFDSRRPQYLAVQPALFAELIETAVTRDEPFSDPDGSWGTRIVRPAGKGWRISDAHRDRHTKWMRRTPIIWQPVKRAAGGWRRR